MAQQIINIGSAPNDGTGDALRASFDKCNLNFTELYDGVTASLPIGNAIQYQFNNSTTEPPASAEIRFNQATQASTTKLWASHTTSSGINIKQFLSAATTGAKLVLQDKNDNTNYIKFDVTGVPVDKTTYWEISVAVTASGGNLPNAAILAAVTPGTSADLSAYAPLASPTFTGDPKAPTPVTGDNDTSVATTAFVKAQGYLVSSDLTSYAPLASPTFTGDPKAPTPTVGDNDTSIATTAFVMAAVAAAGGGTVASVPQEGRLTYVSATALKFAPFNGNKTKINGTIYTIPNAGIAGLGNTGVFVNGTGGQNLAANTVYLICEFDNSGTVTADYRTAATHAISTTAGNEGVEILTGNDTRTLIGMCRTNASSQFTDNATARLVRSWFNRGQVSFSNSFTSAKTTASTTAVELNSEIRVSCVVWSDDAVTASLLGYSYNGFPSYAFSAIGWDGAITDSSHWAMNFGVNGGPLGVTESRTLAEGYHYLTMMAAVISGTATFGITGNYCSLVGGIG